MLMAVLEKKAGLEIAGADVFLNIAGGVKLNEPALDLGVLIALASSHIDRAIDYHTMVFGEIGLGGEIRAVNGATARIIEGKQLGFKKIILPQSNLHRLEKKIEEIELVGVEHITQALDALFY